MQTHSKLIVAAALFAFVPGCASSPAAGAGATQQASSPARSHSSRDVITTDELAKVDVQNALQAVQRLRPNFLQTHGGMSSSMTQGPQDVVVYVDNTRMGGPSSLSQIPITDVKEIQYLNGPDATQRFGTGHGSGAIIVIRK
ncbi:MAG TPA: Plug domain-containing protein [Gemmatimonadaceae bacterium]|nr:Plug domain-containing protein [Gemmatimonadaceae bacterium]